MKRLINKWLGSRLPQREIDAFKRLEEAVDRTIEMSEKYRLAEKETANLKKQITDKDEYISKLQSERDELKKKVREQTEADLYLEAVKIARRIEEGEKVAKDDDSYKRIARHQQSLRAQSIDSSQYPYSGLLGYGATNPLSGRQTL